MAKNETLVAVATGVSNHSDTQIDGNYLWNDTKIAKIN